MDPVTAIGIASTAYQAIVKGFQMGKEVESMAGDLGRWMNALNSIKEGHQKAKSRRIGSIEEEALESFAIAKKAEAMENELRNFIIGNYGMSGWQEIIRLQGEIRKKRQEEIRAREEQVEEIILWSLIVGLVAVVVTFFVWFVSSING